MDDRDGGIADEVITEEGVQAEAQTPEDAGGIADEPAAEPKADGEGQAKQKPEDAAPEQYVLEAAEDFPMPEENLRSFSETCFKAGLSKKQAQAVLDWHKKQYADDVAWRGQQEAQVLDGWHREIQADKEFGGANWKATRADAVRGFGLVDPEGELRAFLRETRYQHNPMIIRAMARVGRAMKEHEFIGRSGTGKSRDIPLEERMYPDMKV